MGDPLQILKILCMAPCVWFFIFLQSTADDEGEDQANGSAQTIPISNIEVGYVTYVL